MTSMERVVAALQGTEADRRAFTMTLSLYGAKLTNCPLTDYYTQPDSYLQGQIAVAEQCKPDILFAPFALSIEAQAFGSELFYPEKSPPNIKKPFIRNPDDIDKLKLPDMEGDDGLNYLLSSARLLTDYFAQRVPVCAVLTSPLDLPAIIMGVENWLEILLFNKSKATAVIGIMSEYFVSMANRMFERGVTFVAMPMMFTNPQFLLKKNIVEFVVPALSAIFAKVKGPIVFHHGSMPISEYLPLYQGLPNIAGFVIDQRDDLDETRRIAGEATLLLGNLEGPTLGKISTEHAIEKARNILENRKFDNHFIFATSSADVAWDTPLHTITGIFDLVQNYRGGNNG